MIDQGSGTFVFSNEELDGLSIGNVVKLLKEETGVSDPARYHIREIGKSNYTYITLYGSVCHDPYSTLKEWGEIDDPFFDNFDDQSEEEDDAEDTALEEEMFCVDLNFIGKVKASSKENAKKMFWKDIEKIAHWRNVENGKGSVKIDIEVEKDNLDIIPIDARQGLVFAGINYWPYKDSYFEGKDEEWNVEEWKEYTKFAQERINLHLDQSIDAQYYSILNEFKKRKEAQKVRKIAKDEKKERDKAKLKDLITGKCRDCSWMGKNYYQKTSQSMPNDLLTRALCFNLGKKRTNTFAHPYKSHAICPDFSVNDIKRCDDEKVLKLLDRLDLAQRALLEESYVNGELEQGEE